MRRAIQLAALAAFVCLLPSKCLSKEKYQNYCNEGAFHTTTQGLQSTEFVQRSFPSCTVQVFLAGTVTLATLFSDNVGTPLGNPFTANSSGYFSFYAGNGRYDVKLYNALIPTPFTWGDILLCDPADGGCGPFFAGEAMQVDGTLIGTEPIFDFLTGTNTSLLGVNDAGNNRAKLTINSCGVTQVGGADVGVCEPKINLIAGSGVTLTPAADHGNTRNNVTIAASGGAVCTNLSQVTDLYVDTTGNDSTGTGTIGNPWLTIPHAIDAGVPGIVCGRYIIHLKTAGTYVGRVNLAGRVFAGGGQTGRGNAYWPYSDSDPPSGITDNTWPYSWVEIVGSTATTGTFFIQPNAGATGTCDGDSVISMSHSNLTLRGVTVRYGGFGVLADNESLLNLAGVAFTASCTDILVNHDSRLHFDGSGTVNDDHQHYITMTNGTVSAVPVNMNDGIVLSDGSFMDDNPSTNDQQPLLGGGAAISFTDNNGAAAALHALNVEAGSYFNLLAEFDVTVNPANSEGACVWMDNAHGTIDGGLFCTGVNSTNTNAVFLKSSVLSMEGNGGIWSLTNWFNGFRLEQGSEISPTDGFLSLTNVTHTFNSRGGGSASPPTIVRSRDIFTGVGSVIQTVAFSATPVFNPSNGGIMKITLTGDVTSSTFTSGSGQDGQEVVFFVCQDSGGGHAFAFPANVHGAGTIDPTASKCNVQQLFYEASSNSYFALAPMVTGQ